MTDTAGAAVKGSSAWEKEAIQRQSFYCKYLSQDGQDTLESYTHDKNSIVHLKNKIGFILFGNPNVNDNSKYADDKSQGEENSDTSVNDIISSNARTNIEVSGGLDSTEEKFESFYCNKASVDMFDFLVKLLDSPSVEQDSNYYRQLVKLIYGRDCHEDSIDNFEEDLEFDLGEQTDSINAGTASTPPSSQDPSPSSSQDEEDYILYYSDPKQIEQIDLILNQIESCSASNSNKGLFVSFIFVVAKIDDNIGEFPVIRVIQSKNDRSAEISYFIDLTGRCYSSWEKFLKENIFPSCIYCYPKNGFYACDVDGNVLVEFGQSPESKGLRKASQYGDLASNIASLGCAGVAVASLLCPIAAPVIIGTSGVGLVSGLWSSGRSIYQLVDKKHHKQPLTGREAAGSWLSVATGVFSVASMGALNYTQYLARNGRVLGRAANWVVNGIEVTNTGLNGVNIGHLAYCMYKERRLNFHDSANLALSLLFFYNSAIKFKTAKQMVIESQNDIINNIENQLSSRQRKAFKRIVKGTTETNLMEGNARVIKTILNLEDPKSYFKGISKVVRTARKTKSKVAFSEDASGKVNINGKVEAHPDIINNMSSKSKKKVFDSSRKWHRNEKYLRLFKKDIKIVTKKENLVFKKNTQELLRKISMKNKHDVEINCGKPINSNLVKNINGFFKIMKQDKNYETINSKIKSKVKTSLSELNLYSLIRLIQSLREAKETYDCSMKYYEENLKDIFEAFIKDVIEYLNQIFKESNEDLKTVKDVFYSKVIDGVEMTPWDYFEKYFQKISPSVPEPDSVFIIPQKAGWLYFLANDCAVRSVYIAPLRISTDEEKVWFHAFINDS